MKREAKPRLGGPQLPMLGGGTLERGQRMDGAYREVKPKKTILAIVLGLGLSLAALGAAQPALAQDGGFSPSELESAGEEQQSGETTTTAPETTQSSGDEPLDGGSLSGGDTTMETTAEPTMEPTMEETDTYSGGSLSETGGESQNTGVWIAGALLVGSMLTIGVLFVTRRA